ncbi:MAG: prephenate dehydrogenase [Thermoguttaceae bacterium]
MRLSRLFIVGVGLIGGSVGLAARKNRLADSVIGIGRDAKRLEMAIQKGCIDKYVLWDKLALLKTPNCFQNETKIELETAENECNFRDIAVLCSPVGLISEHAKIVAENINCPILVTDVGSTKEMICNEILSLPNGCRFVGSHPIAGSEKSGCEFASCSLFDGKCCVVTPSINTIPNDLTQIEQFWTELGSNVVTLSPSEHDAILAKTSHFPHLLSILLERSLNEKYRAFCGTGFTSMTRLAASDAAIWKDIFLSNKKNLLLSLADFQSQLSSTIALLQSEDITLFEQLLKSHHVK